MFGDVMTPAIETQVRTADGTLPSSLMLAGKLRYRLHAGYVLIRRAPVPTHTASGILEIPEKYRDEPMEGVVVQVGPGREYEAQHCMGLGPDFTFGACGAIATARLVPLDNPKDPKLEERPRIFVCPEHVAAHHANGDQLTTLVLSGRLHLNYPPEERRIEAPIKVAALVRPLLTHRPAEVKLGNRVVFSRWAGAESIVDIMGEKLVLTDDVLAVVEGPCPLIIRKEAV